MEENKKEGYSAEGRRLRPRRPRISRNPEEGGPRPYRREGQERQERRYYGGESRSHDEERRPYRGPRSEGHGAPRQHSGYDRSGQGGAYDQPRQHNGYDRPRQGGGYGEHRPSRRPYNTEEEGRAPHRKPSFRSTDRRPGAKPAPRRTPKPGDSGISRMISRKPQLDKIQLSDNDYVPTQIQEEVRLNKFIANSGMCSRREADQLIQAGVVTVNGVVVTELGTKVNVLKDDVRFNGERLKGEAKVYIVMNKPRGYVTSASDPHAEKTVMDLLKKCEYRVFPVGRLDKNTTGVLMFTNDGDMAEKLTHPSYDKKKIYQVTLDSPLSQEHFDAILAGIDLNDGRIQADELEYVDAADHRKLGIEIHSGKNRIVRRIFESLGYDVKALDRVYFAGVTKKGLKRGEWRYLSEGEANVLKMGAYI